MSLSATSSYQLSNLPGSLVPTLPTENAVTAAEASKAANSPDAKQLSMFAEGDDEPSFWDFLDVINPLQHIPIVNNLYREATGDKIGVAARLVGGTLFGGPLGLLTSAANCILEESTGHDAGGHMLALFREEDSTTTGTGTALASAEEKAPAAEAQAARMETSQAQQSQVLAAAEPKVPAESKVSAETKTDDSAKARPLIMPDLVGGDAPATLAQPAAVPVATAPAAVVPAAAPVQTASEQVAAAANRPMPLGRESRFMPIPGRNTPIATQAPPAIGTTVSSTGLRSNAPVVGHRPSAQRAAAAATAQQMMAAQADASAKPAGGQSGDWFTASMMQAMDKYEKSSRLGGPSAGTVSEQ